MNISHQGRLAIVTGGTRGLGRGIAEALRDDEARVIVTGTHADGKPPEGCDYHAVDFHDLDAIERFADQIRLWQPPILVNNAGVSNPKRVDQLETREFMRVLQINLVAATVLCRAAIPAMREAGWGRILNMGSIYGTITRDGRIPYSASKFGLEGMTASLAVEVAKDGILANVIAPGFAVTEMVQGAADIDMAKLAAQIPIGRLANPQEIGRFASWLVSPANTYIAGQALIIDGGLTMV